MGGPGADVVGVGRHVGALENDRPHVGVVAHEPARDAHVLLARRVHVELELVAEQHPGELLLGLHPGDGDRDLAADPGPFEVLRAERPRVHGQDADATTGRRKWTC